MCLYLCLHLWRQLCQGAVERHPHASVLVRLWKACPPDPSDRVSGPDPSSNLFGQAEGGTARGLEVKRHSQCSAGLQFLDTSVKTAPIAYFLLFASHWIFYGLFALAAKKLQAMKAEHKRKLT